MMARQQPMMMARQQPMMVSSGLVKGPLPMQVAQPRMMMVRQPRMMVQQPRMVVQQPQMVLQQPGVQVRNIQVSPMVTEQHIVQQTRKIIRKTRKPVQKQIGTKMVETFELVEEKNPATMRMSTEFAEPYIKRDGYVQENCGVIGKTTTKVIRRGQSVNRQTTVRTVPVVAAPTMTRGYTRIDTWKHVGDGQRH